MMIFILSSHDMMPRYWTIIHPDYQCMELLHWLSHNQLTHTRCSLNVVIPHLEGFSASFIPGPKFHIHGPGKVLLVCYYLLMRSQKISSITHLHPSLPQVTCAPSHLYFLAVAITVVVMYPCWLASSYCFSLHPFFHTRSSSTNMDGKTIRIERELLYKSVPLIHPT